VNALLLRAFAHPTKFFASQCQTAQLVLAARAQQSAMLVIGFLHLTWLADISQRLSDPHFPAHA